jgi:alpha-mannosidase
MERALDFARESGFEIATCLMNDVPGFSADLPDVLAEKGVMYFMSGINDAYG